MSAPAKAEAKAEAKMSPEELKKALEEKAKAPHKAIVEHESRAVVEARTLAAITSGKVHLKDVDTKGEGLSETAKAAYLEDKKAKESGKAEAPKA